MHRNGQLTWVWTRSCFLLIFPGLERNLWNWEVPPVQEPTPLLLFCEPDECLDWVPSKPLWPLQWSTTLWTKHDTACTPRVWTAAESHTCKQSERSWPKSCPIKGHPLGKCVTQTGPEQQTEHTQETGETGSLHRTYIPQQNSTFF